MMKLETHCHTFGGSTCATTPIELQADIYKKAGYGAVVVTNHYNFPSINAYKGETLKEKLRGYFSLIDVAKEVFSERGIKIFFGAEVQTKTESPDGYQEFMLYGFDANFLFDAPTLYELNQKELFRLAEENGLFMYQTHPFRPRVILGEPAYMHGAEAFNGHYHHRNNNDLATEFCLRNGLISLSGTDFHHEDQPVTGGLLVPDNVNGERELVDYIRRGKAELLREEKVYEEALKNYIAHGES